MADEPDSDTVAFAHWMFDLARAGNTEGLIGYVHAGLPVTFDMLALLRPQT